MSRTTERSCQAATSPASRRDALEAERTTAADEMVRLRCEATLKTLAEVIGAGRRGEPVLAMRTYHQDCVAAAVGGVVDPVMLDRLRALLDESQLAGPPRRELVLDLSQVLGCAPGLAAVLEQLHEHGTRHGCHVELRDPPPSLADELDRSSLTEAFIIYEAVQRSTRG